MLGHRQTAAAGAALGLIVGLMLGAGAALAQGPTVAGGLPASGSSMATGAPPVAGPPTTGVGTGRATSGGVSTGDGVAAAGAAIAYPYFGGSPGVAPDDTIVVTGAGQADMRTDGSDRATAQKTAFAAALADAETQAEAIARGTGLSIAGVLSVSASVSPYGPVPYAVATPGSASGKGVPVPSGPEVWPPALSVSVTVAYKVG